MTKIDLKNSGKIALSIVVPIYNEAQNIENLHNEVLLSLRNFDENYELIYIDDASTDGSYTKLKKLKDVCIIKFRRNFGQTAAIYAGMMHANGNYIVTIDGDGQNDPKDILRLYSLIKNSDFSCISGWRKYRKDSIPKRIISRGAFALRSLLINDGIHDSGCTLKIIKAEALKDLSLYGELHRFIPALLALQGFKTTETEVNHRPRQNGTSKYNWRRIMHGLVDIIAIWFWSRYYTRPLHLFGGLGIISIAMSIFLALFSFTIYLNGSDFLSQVTPLLSAMFMMAGIQLFTSGLISDRTMRTDFNITKTKPYQIENILQT
jgi:glycosyltransferase involved in cell wall biosynthesis